MAPRLQGKKGKQRAHGCNAVEHSQVSRLRVGHIRLDESLGRYTGDPDTDEERDSNKSRSTSVEILRPVGPG